MVKNRSSAAARRLRAAAEAALVQAPSPAGPQRSVEELLHELQVHGIELEMQNETLRESRLALEESRDRYVDLYEFAPVGYLSLSSQGFFTDLNLTCATLLGLARGRLQWRFAHFVAHGARDHWHRFFAQALVADGRQVCELEMRRRDGNCFQARLECLPVPAPGAGLRVSMSDITEQKLAEEKLRIAAIAFESQEGMIVTDSRGVILQANRAFTRLTGYRQEELVGQTPALFASGRHEKAFYEEMWQSLAATGSWQGEVWNRRRDGKIYADWLTISAVMSPTGLASHYVGTFSEITLNKEAEAEIHRLAYYDPLTHLPNRRLLQDRINQALVASNRSSQHGALLFLDLDHFKNLNDTRGHPVGDQLLFETARRILDHVRAGDTVARLGGDEFVVMLEELSMDATEAALQAGQVGEKIREALALPYDLEGGVFHCPASIGVTLFRGHDELADVLLKHADLALYKAKGAGRNTLRFFDPAMQTSLDERSALEADLRLALARGQLHLYYQAQIDGGRQIIGAEALLRWAHPVRGLVLPGNFIPLAEETGLILPIGLWVLETACTRIKAWSLDPATRDLHLAVNVSARQFRQPGFVAQVQDVLMRTGADPQRLKIELTESLVIEDVADTIARMQALKALGIGFSMDDFGTGFSSLSYLKRLPLDQLKIDSSFVLDLASDPNDEAIVKTIVTMGKILGLGVIAEGVETEAQLARLREYGCLSHQGFLFARPLPLLEFESLLGGGAGFIRPMETAA